VDDQREGAEYLKTLPFVDPEKIAIYGWSYGGYMTLKQLQADPGLFAAGISGAPVTKWELYDTPRSAILCSSFTAWPMTMWCLNTPQS